MQGGTNLLSGSLSPINELWLLFTLAGLFLRCQSEAQSRRGLMEEENPNRKQFKRGKAGAVGGVVG